MAEQIKGQLSIFDIQEPGHEKRPCEYSFQRYIGQRVRGKSKYGLKYIGTITGIQQYYTDILTDDGHRIVGTPYDVEPLGSRTCGNCKYFFRYVAGIGKWIHGTACGVNRPLSVNKEPGCPACDQWEQKGEE